MEVKRGFIFDPSLVLYLPLYELDGTSFMSKDKHGHLGTVTGATWGSQGRTFDGLDDDIDVGNQSALNFDISNPFSIVAWVKPTNNSAYYCICSKQLGATTYQGYVIFIRGAAPVGVIEVVLTNTNVGDKTARIRTATIYDNAAFRMFGVSYDGSGVAAGLISYTNGVVDVGSRPTDALAGGAIASSANFMVGDRTAADIPFKGIIGELLVYNRVLTAVEFMHIYQATKWRYR